MVGNIFYKFGIGLYVCVYVRVCVCVCTCVHVCVCVYVCVHVGERGRKPMLMQGLPDDHQNHKQTTYHTLHYLTSPLTPKTTSSNC